MKFKKIIKKVEALFNNKEQKRQGQIKSIKKLLKKLRKYEKSLHQKQEKTYDSESKKKLNHKINLTHAQRKKGLKLLKKINKD